MGRKFTKTELWYLLSNKNYIMSFKKFDIEKPYELYWTKKQFILNEIPTKKNRRRSFKKRGRRIPFIYWNRVYLGKKKQVGSDVVSETLGCILEIVGNISDFNA